MAPGSGRSGLYGTVPGRGDVRVEDREPLQELLPLASEADGVAVGPGVLLALATGARIGTGRGGLRHEGREARCGCPGPHGRTWEARDWGLCGEGAVDEA